MRLINLPVLSGILFVMASHVCTAETMETDWIVQQSRSAIGQLGGGLITAAASSDAEFVGLSEGSFSGEQWDTGSELSAMAEALVVGDANPGDTHTFVFTESLSNVHLYIENFDSSSVASVTLEGTGPLSLFASSPSVTYSPTDSNSGVLTTSNASSDGEGDLILMLGGSPESLSIDFTSGDGQNGVFYTFAVPIPEPSSSGLLVVGLIGVMMLRRRFASRS